MSSIPESAASAHPANPTRDPWSALQHLTSARIALGRTGGSLRTRSVLDFRLAHARARDAVHAPFALDEMERQFSAHQIATERLATAINDRPTYLMRPDLGRQLDPASRAILRRILADYGQRDLAILVSDGHSAQATLRHAAETVARLAHYLDTAGWTRYPVLLIPFARVKLQDEIGALLHVRHTLIFLGERPGLSAPDSLGAYFTHNPNPACTDADRNCVSNIRPEGLPIAAAAQKLAQLLLESARLGVSGVNLKDQLQTLPAESRLVEFSKAKTRRVEIDR
ncbi:MAG: ethanolamine ammonia-lyase subunit EutC [Zoogloeaceae bacterium]|jgi:ethanolamine ammonia-lyase small subunit|nr:ethanolamine ammonia-lyase subunit EutC [Zoogloeaceae bacterium]